MLANRYNRFPFFLSKELYLDRNVKKVFLDSIDFLNPPSMP
jgi:hypothetical protein